MANAVPANSLYKFLSHKQKVLSLYKRAQRHLESHCAPYGRATYCYERTLLRARFDKYKDEKDPIVASQIVKLAEEEFWLNQHEEPITIHNHPDGFAYNRHVTYQVDEKEMDKWPADEKAHFPDYFANREKWQQIRKDTWEDEMKSLQEWDKMNIEAGKKITDDLPAASKKDGYPPFWWRKVTRPLEKPKLMEWFPDKKDHWG